MRKLALLLISAVLSSASYVAPAYAQAPPRASANVSLLRGKITMGPTIPEQRMGGPPATAPVVGARVDVASVNGATVASATTGADGGYSVPLAPGSYLVTVRPAIRMLRRIPPRSVIVKPGAPTALDIALDTGIR